MTSSKAIVWNPAGSFQNHERLVADILRAVPSIRENWKQRNAEKRAAETKMQSESGVKQKSRSRFLGESTQACSEWKSETEDVSFAGRSRRPGQLPSWVGVSPSPKVPKPLKNKRIFFVNSVAVLVRSRFNLFRVFCPLAAPVTFVMPRFAQYFRACFFFTLYLGSRVRTFSIPD